jgi:hypothetical protein
MRHITLLTALFLGTLLLGCGSKKAKVESGESADKADAGAEPAKDAKAAGAAPSDGIEAEANTGPVDYPEPPKRNAAERNPIKFKVSVTKAYVLPLSEDGACFDKCSKDAKTTMVNALPGLAGEQFGSAAKALTTAIGAKGAKESLPDIYVHVNCGAGQELTTHKTSAENRLVANWRGVGETLKLDVKDQCAISVWDADEDGDDERIGDTLVPIIEVAKDGAVTLTSEDNEFGQVYLVEIFLEQLEGASVWKKPATSSGGAVSTEPKAGTGSGSGSSSGGSAGSTPEPSKPDPSGAASYAVEILKANLKKTKDTGEKWDVRLPFVGKAGDEAPDPYVEAYINGYQSEKPFMKTDAANNKNYYEWRKTGQAKLKADDKIHFMVWDKDQLDRDLMGECITDQIQSVKSGSSITMRDCGQVDFIVVKITRK